MSSKPHQTQATGNMEWFTPLWIIDIAQKVMGGIDLDPATTGKGNLRIDAKRYYTKENNGLVLPWFDRVWLNPPYAVGTMQPFINKLCHHLYEGDIDQAMILTNNGTETKWGQQLFAYTDMVCFLQGRIQFLDENGETPLNNKGEKISGNLQGQCLWYAGNNIKMFRRIAGLHGTVMVAANGYQAPIDKRRKEC